MEEGDVFYLHVLDEVLAYKVDQIKVVLPEETQDIGIVEGKDYCTLVTCTPYAINTHRLLVVVSGPSTSRRRSWQNRMQCMKYSPRPSRSGSWMYGRGWLYPC